MKMVRTLISFIFCFQSLLLLAPTSGAQEGMKKPSKTLLPNAFEPLDSWKAAVLAGDKSALTSFYMTNPAARA